MMAPYFDSLVGKKFGKLTVLEPTGKTINGKKQWRCRCDCGGYKDVLSTNLTNGHVQSCGCMGRGRVPHTDLAGKRFGSLVVIRRVRAKTSPIERKESLLWECKCDCGNIVCKETEYLYKEGKNACDECIRAGRRTTILSNGGFVEGTQLPKLKHDSQKSNNKTGIRGVYFNAKKNRYRATITFQGKQRHLGYFYTLEEAAKARDCAEQELFESFLEKQTTEKKAED